MKPHGYLSLINNCSDSISSLPNLTSTREGNNHQIREDTSKSHEAKGKRPGLFGSRTKESSSRSCCCCDCYTSPRSGSGFSVGGPTNPIVSRVLKKSTCQTPQSAIQPNPDKCLHKLVRASSSLYTKPNNEQKLECTNCITNDDEVYQEADTKLDATSKVTSLTQRVINKVASLVAPNQASSQATSLSNSSSPKLTSKVGLTKTASLEQHFDDRVEKALAREQARRTRSLERNHRHLVTLDSGCRDSSDLSVRYQPDPTFKPIGHVSLSSVPNGIQSQRALVSNQKFSLDTNLFHRQRPLNTNKAPSSQHKGHLDSLIINKPTRGWLHPDHLVLKDGVSFNVRYVGCIEVKTSMKQLDYKIRSEIAKECINIVCESSGHKNSAYRTQRLVKPEVSQLVGSFIQQDGFDTVVHLTVTSRWIKLSDVETGLPLYVHEMPNISFASGGDHPDMVDYVAYVAKDNTFRGCYVLECIGGLAQDVISTIGQAFELRFKEFLKQQPSTKGLQHSQNDLLSKSPCKVPEIEVIKDLPEKIKCIWSEEKSHLHRDSVGSNLIDFNTEILPMSKSHDFENEHSKHIDQDPFEIIKPESQSQREVKHNSFFYLQSQLLNEKWFHGSISRREAESLIKKDGDFLVRESKGTPGQFVLTGMENNLKKHLLLVDGEGIVRTKDMTFDSVNHLINYHMDKAIPIISSDSPLRLLTPISTSTNILTGAN